MQQEIEKYNQIHYGNADQQAEDDISFIYQLTALTELNPDVDAAWKKVNDKINKRQKGNFYWLKIAAIFLLVGFIGILVNQVYKSEPQTLTYSSPTDQTEIALPDGSVVVLKSGSTIEYGTSFDQNRQVSLKGDAYFKIVKSDFPFTVLFGPQAVTVLGTQFVVEQTSEFNKVSVVEGSVQVRTNLHEIILTDRQEIVFDYASQTLGDVQQLDINDVAWATNVFEFRETSLGDAVKILSNHFEIDITLKSQRLSNCRITGSFSSESLNDIINNIATVLDIKYTYANKEYILKGKGC